MKKNIFKLFLLSVFAFCCFAIPKQEIKVSASTNDNFIIQAYGDSISYGETLENTSDAYPSVFAKYYIQKFNAEFYANGVSGYTSSNLLEQLQPYKDRTASDIDRFDDTDLVLVCIGANNVLGSATDNISSYITGSLTEQEFREILQANVDQFKLDYPEILSTFENKQIITMTIYNPYKYSTLKDIQIDSSVNSTTASFLKSVINNYDAKFQEMLDISMEYLNIINNEIRSYESEDIYVVDIWNLFSSFNKTQYQDYINSNPSSITLTNADVSELLKGNLNNIMPKVQTSCDPHPTKAGHNIIAEKHLESFNIFKLNKTADSENNDNSILKLTTILNENYTYKYYKIENNKKTLLEETTETSISIKNSEIENATELFVEVYSGDELIETSNSLYFSKATQNKTNTVIIICVVAGISIIAIVVPICFVAIKKKKFKF